MQFEMNEIQASSSSLWPCMKSENPGKSFLLGEVRKKAERAISGMSIVKYKK